MKSIELFTGAGGLALGTHLAGFHHLAVLEVDKPSCNTLRHNSKQNISMNLNWQVIETDVSKFNYEPYMNQLDFIAGGAPCQPFSLGGRHLGHLDKRNMFPEAIRAIREIKPRAFLLENVKGLTRANFLPYFYYLITQLKLPTFPPYIDETWEEHLSRLQNILENNQNLKVGDMYSVKYRVYSVADFGIPQDRHRVFIVGFRKDLGIEWNFPEPTHSIDALLYSQYVDKTYWIEHNIKPKSVPNRWKKRVENLSKFPKPLLQRWRTVRDAIADLPEPIDYDSNPSINAHVGIPDARIYPGHTGSEWDWPAKTIKAGSHGNPGGENMLLKDDGTVRYFTTRELARLQTFPDNWEFLNSWTENRRQLGNAVPVSMAKFLAKRIFTELVILDQE